MNFGSPRHQEPREQLIERCLGARQHIIDLLILAPLFKLLAISVELAQVRLPQHLGLGEYLGHRFEAVELGGTTKGKVEFRRIEHMKHDDVMPTMPAMSETREHVGRIIE